MAHDKKDKKEGKGKVPGFMKEMKRGDKVFPARGKAPGFMKEIAASGRKGEPARKAGGQRMHAWSEPMTKEQKAQELTRKMKKGYRKGYRVGKRPAARKSSGR